MKVSTFTRYEFKYQITPAVAEAIRARLLRVGLEPDPESVKFPRNTYPVTSLYFDTPAMDDYHDKAGGFLRRKKIRVRIYAPYLTSESSDVAFSFCRRAPCDIPTAVGWNGDQDKKQNVTPNSQCPEIWLEKKEKYEMLVSKKRVPLTIEEYDNLLYGSRLDIVQRAQLFLPLLTHSMRPAAIVRYLREPFVSLHQSRLRITFDSAIEACRAHDLRFPALMTPVAKNTVIMEVKFSFGIPYWFKPILSDYDLRRQSFSKYGEAMEALHRFHPIPR